MQDEQTYLTGTVTMPASAFAEIVRKLDKLEKAQQEANVFRNGYETMAKKVDELLEEKKQREDT